MPRGSTENLVAAIGFGKMHIHAMILRHIAERQADKIGLDRKFAPAAIDQHRQADRAGPAEVVQGVRAPRGSIGR